jgi:four helix bundle protein
LFVSVVQRVSFIRGARVFLLLKSKIENRISKTTKGKHMAKYERFEQTPAWQQAVTLYNAVLDLLEKPQTPFSAAYRNQLERAALSVSNNIAEGFERGSTHELSHFLEIARGSAAEVRSMSLAIVNRPRVKPYIREMEKIRALAEGCCKQLGGWSSSVSQFEFQGTRRASMQTREMKEREKKAKEFRSNFLKNLSREHPLYNSSEAREARGEL